MWWCLPPLNDASDDDPEPDDDDWFVELLDKFNEAVSLLALDAWFVIVTCLAVLLLLLRFDAADAFDDADDAEEDASDELDDDDDPSESLHNARIQREEITNDHEFFSAEHKPVYLHYLSLPDDEPLLVPPLLYSCSWFCGKLCE